MKISKVLTFTALAVVLSASNLVMAKDLSGFNIAVVNIPKVVESSPQISALKTDRQNKLTDLDAFVQKARADVEKETDAAKKKALEDKYNKELNTRKNDIDADYSQKLMEIDKNITAIISKKARKLGYDLTLVKSSVLDGGVDITEDVLKEIK